MADPLESEQEEGLAASEDNLAEEDDEDDQEDDDEDDEEDEEEDDEEDDEPQYRRQRKRRKFVPPPPRELPQRTTRGRRMGTAAALQDEEADQEFWDQEFFAEEDQDEVYETESEPEDRFDADFLESEEGEDDEENVDQTEKELRQQERKKTLKPPGYKVQKGPVKSMQKKTSSARDMEQSKEKAVFIPAERTISVRESTRQKVQEAEDERKQMEASKPKKVVKPTNQRILTQAELLAEAARTEIENTKSLQYLVAIEEESKKKVDANRAKYVGPLIRLRSVGEGRRIQDAMPALKDEDGATLGDEGTVIEERTTLEVRNMQVPAFLQPQRAPARAGTPVCIITGRPAKYKDPVTGFPYADIGAYKELKRRYHSQNLHHPQQQQRLLSQQRWGFAVQAG